MPTTKQNEKPTGGSGMNNKKHLNIKELEWRKPKDEGDLFGQLPHKTPCYLLIQHGAVPYRYRLEARYSKKLRICLSWKKDSFADEMNIQIDRTEWKMTHHDFHIGYLKNRFAMLSRPAFIERFNMVSRTDFETVESALNEEINH